MTTQDQSLTLRAPSVDEKGLEQAISAYISASRSGGHTREAVSAAITAYLATTGRAAVLEEAASDDPESLDYALSIGRIGRPYRDHQGALYMDEMLKADQFPDAEFRDYGLARAVRVILNNVDVIRRALKSGSTP